MADARQSLVKGGAGGPARMSRARKAEATRRKLIDAAARVVGAEGYANASVAKITTLAEVAQGTFYNYFSSQQDLFDHLLPELGGELLDFIRTRIAAETDSFRREEIGFRAFFEFVAERPEFYRILNEAETFSPRAFEDHMRNMAEGYLRALEAASANGEVVGFAPHELEVVVYTLLAARNYLCFRFMDGGRSRTPLPQWVVDAYMKLIERGMLAGSGGGRRRAARKSSGSSSGPVSEPDITIDDDGSVVAHIRLAGRDREAGRAQIARLIEVAGGRAARAAEPLALNITYLRPVEGANLRATARAQAAGGTVIATVAVEASDGRDQGAVATATAIYAAPPAKPPRRQRAD